MVNFLKPTGYVTHHQFNIQQLYALPTLYLCVLYLSENKQRLVPLTAQTGFCNRDEKCLLRGADWVFKYSSLRFVFKGLNFLCPVQDTNVSVTLLMRIDTNLACVLTLCVL
jgi:hypothetical protein